MLLEQALNIHPNAPNIQVVISLQIMFYSAVERNDMQSFLHLFVITKAVVTCPETKIYTVRQESNEIGAIFFLFNSYL